MRNLFSLVVIFLGLVGVATAQHGQSHGHEGGQAPHYSAPVQHDHAAPPARGGFRSAPPRDFRHGYGDWYGRRPEYRGFGWGHYHGWYYRPYRFIGPGYCYTGTWGAPYFSFGFNGSRWRVLDFDFGIMSGWYSGSCAYIMEDPYHYGWFYLYDQQTGQYVHVEQY